LQARRAALSWLHLAEFRRESCQTPGAQAGSAALYPIEPALRQGRGWGWRKRLNEGVPENPSAALASDWIFLLYLLRVFVLLINQGKEKA
jgi:hypothetical protein